MLRLSKNVLFALWLLLIASTTIWGASIYVHYDVGFGNHISIRGDAASLSWTKGQAANWSADNVWVFSTSTSEGGFSFKPLINDETWSIGGNYLVPTGDSQVHIYPFFHSTKGQIVTIADFASEKLKNKRSLRIYLPPSYQENQSKRYPVLYMHDGQNLFDPATAFGGVEWQVDEIMDLLIQQGQIREAIVVGADNTRHRLAEYTPMPDPKYGGGNGDAYLDFIEQELMPFVKSRYRTLSESGNTMLMGSSLGGLISFYGGWKRSAVFGAVGCVSSSFWWNEQALPILVENHSGNLPACRIYLDIGGLEGSVPDSEKMRDALKKLGYVAGKNMLYYYDAQGRHNEASWAKRVHIPLKFVVGGWQ